MRVHTILDHQTDPLLLLDGLKCPELFELYEGHLSKRIMIIDSASSKQNLLALEGLDEHLVLYLALGLP